MKKKVLTAFLAMILMVLSTLTLNCAAPSSGDPDDLANPGPGPGEMTVMLHYTIPEFAENLVAENPTAYITDEDWYYLNKYKSIMPASDNIGINAVSPGPSPTYVGIGGFSVKQAGCTTYSPYEPACLRNVTTYCPGGICAIPLNVPKNDYMDVYFYYGGMVRPDNITVTVNGTAYPLGRFMLMNLNRSLLPGDPNQRQWVTACFFVDQGPTGPIVRTDNPACTLAVTDLWSAEIFITGISYSNSLNDPRAPYDGTTVHDGDIRIRGTLLPDTMVPPATDDFPRVLYGVSAYTHTVPVFAANMGGILAVYSSSRAPTAPAGDISPILGGVYIRTRRLSSPTVIVCNISNPLSELHYVIANGTITQGGSGLVVNMLYYQFTGINPVTGCPTQNATDNRLQNMSGS